MVYRTADERKALRRVLARAQGGLCPICGDPFGAVVWADPPWWNRQSLDHVVPKARRGLDDIGNLLSTHLGCNNEKGDRMPTGCELIWLLAVNARIGAQPTRW